MARLLAMSSAMFVAAFLVACSAATPTAAPERGGTPTPAPTPGPDTLVWAIQAAPSTLDPARMTIDAAGTQVSAQIYDRLMSYRPGAPDLAPGIASDWDVDPEGRTFTFTLRDGLTFHDGTPLDAAAVAWNFQRWMDPDHPSHHGDFKPWGAYFGGFSGQRDQEGREVNLVKRVEALDAATVRITLNEPFMPFLHHLAMVPFSLASPTAVREQGEAYGTNGDNLPVGSGPFRVVGWSPDGAVRLEPFGDHWSGPAGVSGLHFVAVPDIEKRVEAVADGAVHGADLPPRTPVTGTLTMPTVRVVARPARSNAWLMLNHSRTPLEDVRVRRAISLVLDRDSLAEEQFGYAAIPSGQLLPPGFLGHDPAIEPTQRDLGAARRLMREAEVEDGFDLNVWVPTTARPYLPNPAGTANAVAEMLADINIDVAVHTEGLRKFLADRDSGRFTAWITGWEAQSGDPDNFWFWHFGAGRSGAEGQYYNDGLSATLLDAQRLLSTDARAEIYHGAAQTVVADEARAFLAYARPLVAVSSRTRGFEPGAMGFDDLSLVSMVPAPAGATAVPIPTGAPTAEATPTPLGTAEAVTDDDAEADGDETAEEPDGDDTVEGADGDGSAVDTSPRRDADGASASAESDRRRSGRTED